MLSPVKYMWNRHEWKPPGNHGWWSDGKPLQNHRTRLVGADPTKGPRCCTPLSGGFGRMLYLRMYRKCCAGWHIKQIKKKSGQRAKIKYWHDAEKINEGKKLLLKAWLREHGLYVLLSDYSGDLAAKGYPTLSLQPEHCRRVQLKFPASEVQRQLALYLSLDAKSQSRPLSSYARTHTQLSTCFRTRLTQAV